MGTKPIIVIAQVNNNLRSDIMSKSKPFPIILIALLCLIPNVVSAQLIKLKTAPVATGDQFLVQPGVNTGMGGISIALDDTLGDAFVNPAKAARIRGLYLYTLPAFYRISDKNGSARTLSIGAVRSGGKWFGGLGVALQGMTQASTGGNLLQEESANNNYLWIQGGTMLGDEVAAGAQIFWAGLGAMDGVDLLYPRSDEIKQEGHLMDIRLGLQGQTSGSGQYEAMVLFSRTDMTHKVVNRYFFFAQPASQFLGPQSFVEENPDKTNTWGLHLGYDQPVGDQHWRLGGIFTLNYKTHPKIPNYELMNIPRDPGNTWAFDVGIGASYTSDQHLRFGADFIIEPIWSNTWAEAQQDIVTPEPAELLVANGEKTIENDFAFFNSVIKTGLGWSGEKWLLEGGIRAKTWRYRLKQWNYVENTFRRQREHWTEWTFSLAAGTKWSKVGITYTALLTTGTGQPSKRGVLPTPDFAATAGGDFIFAPESELLLDKATVLTHQLVVTIPL
jgi:hypothetical protein